MHASMGLPRGVGDAGEPNKQTVPGLQADRPSEIPKAGWIQIIKRAWKEAKKDQVPLLSAGVAFTHSSPSCRR